MIDGRLGWPHFAVSMSENVPLASSLLTGPEVWQETREAVLRSDAVRSALQAQTASWLTTPILSVVQKTHPSPSGDPHDYVSFAAYWWPDPARPVRSPYVRRDGEVNPEFYEYDNARLESLCYAVPHLVFAAVFLDSLPHACQAGKLLRAWFLDEATRMNPHLRHGQFIPGLNDGRSIGIIDTTSLIFLLDAVVHLPFNDGWTPGHLDGLRQWVSSYLDWLLESKFGHEERRAEGNHGSWYDAQVCCFASFCGRADIARRQIVDHAIPRILEQIESDGTQPVELTRTLSLTYSTYNLLAFTCTARIAKGLGIDLWTPAGPAAGRLLQSLEWLFPYYAGQAHWPYQQIRPFTISGAAPLLHLVGQETGNAVYARLSQAIEAYPWQKLILSKSALAARKDSSGSSAGVTS